MNDEGGTLVEERYPDRQFNGNAGEWDHEPDRAGWVNTNTRYRCLVVRQNIFGAWCGYVEITPGHPLYGNEDYDSDGYSSIQVHGGLTFSRLIEADHPIHYPGDDPDTIVHWVGFDCAHSMDKLPAYLQITGGSSMGTYRNYQYVREQVNDLAVQLSQLDVEPQ